MAELNWNQGVLKGALCIEYYQQSKTFTDARNDFSICLFTELFGWFQFMQQIV